MANINNFGRPTYIFDTATNQWYPIAGKADVTAPYTWTGIHDFNNNVSFENNIFVKKGLNTFLNFTARDTMLTSPVYGTTAFVRQDNDGNTINDFQFFDAVGWQSITDPVFTISEKTTSYTLQMIDSYSRMIEMVNGGTVTIPPASDVAFAIGTAIDIVQTGTSQVTIAAGSGVTVNSTPGLKLRTQWSSATLVKRAPNKWLVMGDLVA